MRPKKIECKRCFKETRYPKKLSWFIDGLCPHCYDNTAQPILPQMETLLSDLRLRTYNPVDHYFNMAVMHEMALNGDKYE